MQTPTPEQLRKCADWMDEHNEEWGDRRYLHMAACARACARIRELPYLLPTATEIIHEELEKANE